MPLDPAGSLESQEEAKCNSCAPADLCCVGSKRLPPKEVSFLSLGLSKQECSRSKRRRPQEPLPAMNTLDPREVPMRFAGKFSG